MPLVRKIETNLWEVRSHLAKRRIARVLFTANESQMALLHGFIKKSRKTPAEDLQLARQRKNLWLSERGNMNRYSGSTLDELLAEEGILEEVSAKAHKRLLVLQLTDIMQESKLS